jgi:ParB-like chromosome segregation protein Spo0J
MHFPRSAAHIRSTTSVATSGVKMDRIVAFEDGRRPLDSDAVERLMKSIGRDGLKTPVDVMRITKGMLKGRYRLVTGAHRFAAYRRLGKTTIPAKIVDRDQAFGLEETENLFRSEPTFLHESIAIVRYAKKLELDRSKSPPLGGKQPHDQGYARLARATGYDRKRIADAYAHNTLTDVIKSRIYNVGLADNRKFLTQIAKLKTIAEQKKLIRDRAGQLKSSAIADKRKPRAKLSEDNQGVVKLSKFWAKSYFKKTFDREAKAVQQKFLRLLMAE